MRITKHILNLCLSGFILSACTEPEMENARTIPIQFSASTNKVAIIHSGSTRTNDDDSEALIIDDITKLKDEKITLYGTEYANGAMTKTWDFMDGWEATVRQSGSDHVFDYATANQMKYYAPRSGLKYDFRAVFPAVSSDTATGVYKSPLGFPYVKVKLEYRPDLIVATADGITKPSSSGYTIPFRFEHQLALITFNIYKDIQTNSTPGDEGHNIYLNKMTLAGRTIANFDVTKNEFSSVDAKTGATIRVPGYPYSDFLIEKTSKKIRDIFLFPSMGNISSDKYTFDFFINENDYQVILPADDKKWEAGKHYIYNMKVVGSDVYIELADSQDESTKLTQEKWEDKDMEEEVGIIEGK